MNRIRLVRLKHWLAGLKERLVEFVVRMGVFVTGLLPSRIWFLIREKTAVVRRMDYDRHSVYMCVDSWIEKDVRLHSCKKEPETIAWIESWFTPGDVFYDIGANVGSYSLVAFRFFAGKIRIYSFEPGFVTFPQLSRNIYINGASEAIIPFQLALSEQTIITPFHYQNITPGGALHALGAPVDYCGKKFKPVFTLPTLSYRLEDFVCQFGLPVPNHIKIDVDGTEYQILKGAVETLSRLELRSILVEINKEHEDTDKIKRLLEENRFVVHSHHNENTLYIRKY